MEKNIHIVENVITWQGEIFIGVRMLLLRFQKCNRIEAGIGCPWCDTAVKLRISQPSILSLKQIQNIISEQNCGLLITGGEPSFSVNFDETLLLLNEISNYPVANVESNGCQLVELISRVDISKPVRFVYSPKIFTELELEEEIKRTEELKKYQQVFIKVVYENRQLIITYLEFLSKLDINQRVYLMPEGDTREKLIERAGEVFDACEKYKFNFSTRSHIIYGFV